MNDPTLAEILEELRAIRVLLEGPADDGLLTAQQVADRLGVDRAYVYSNADRLGAIRLPSPSGARPRLRFPRDAALPDPEPPVPARPTAPEVELLPIAGRPGTRNGRGRK